MEATKTVAKYERVGEPQRMRLLDHMSNAHCALPPCVKGPFEVHEFIVSLVCFRFERSYEKSKSVAVLGSDTRPEDLKRTYGGALLSECGVDVV